LGAVTVLALSWSLNALGFLLVKLSGLSVL
jgi:hypothetical protein